MKYLIPFIVGLLVGGILCYAIASSGKTPLSPAPTGVKVELPTGKAGEHFALQVECSGAAQNGAYRLTVHSAKVVPANKKE